MVDKNRKVTQLAERIDSQSAVALTDKQKLSIYKKSQKYGYPVDILEEVYFRGVFSWEESSNQTPEQFGFSRVNSFISGGKAANMDKDLFEREVWDEPNPKENNSEKLSPADKSAAKARAAKAGRKYPNLVDNMWAAQRNEETCDQDPESNDPNDPSSRFVGTDSLTNIYKNATPGQSKTIKAIKDVVRDVRESEELSERAVSKAQRGLMGAALAYKRGETESASAEVRRLAKTMTEKQLRDFTGTKEKGLPERVDEITLPRTDSPSLNSRTKNYVTNSQIRGYGSTGAGESDRERRINDIIRSPATPGEIERDNAASGRRVGPDGRVTFDGVPNPSRTGSSLEGRVGLDNPFTMDDVSDTPRSLRQRRRDLGMTDSGDMRDRPSEREEPRGFREETLQEATYKGKKVKLNKPFRTPGGKKKFAVYVDPDGDGKAKIVRFGDPNMTIKKNQPGRKKSYCARSGGQGNLTNKSSANYWSRKMWDC